MSYRTYINGHEWLGNGNLYDEIYEELKRQGCPFDKEDYVDSFEVKDFNALVVATEKVIERICKHDEKVTNWNPTIMKDLGQGNGWLTMTLDNLRENAFIFISATLLEYTGGLYKAVDFALSCDDATGKNYIKYYLRDGYKCIFSAH